MPPKVGDHEQVYLTQTHSFEATFNVEETDELMNSVRVPVLEAGAAARAPEQSKSKPGAKKCSECEMERMKTYLNTYIDNFY